MGRVLLQLHAVPDELVEFAQLCIDHLDIFAVVIGASPASGFRAVPKKGRIRDVLHAGELPGRVCFTVDAARGPVQGPQDFLKRNPDALVLQLGSSSAQCLGESILSAITDDPDTLALWRRIANKLRRLTRAGAWARNPRTGTETYVRTHRFTEAARSLYRRGVTMAAIAGCVEYRFPSR